jgi:hypothetical protein
MRTVCSLRSDAFKLTIQICLDQENFIGPVEYSVSLCRRVAVNVLSFIFVCRSGSVSSDESWDSEKEDAAAEWAPPLNPAEWTVGAMNPLPEGDEVLTKDASSSKFLRDAMAA